jgi:23S rRNA (cytidine1920-2'-O)/16S rRNA (cytidine1409-2'-O)-methyltransferase
VKRRQRLDLLLVEHGLASSREKARALILGGEVTVAGQTELRASALIEEGAEILLTAGARFASRGGEKLDHALTHFGVDVSGRIALDAGASTGGFTDCLLQRGAARVYAVDVGHGQLHARLRDDARVVVMERVNARELPRLSETPSLATVDVAFISLTIVLPSISASLTSVGDILALVKPQFEAGKGQVDRRGVVRDPLVHAEVIGRVAWWCVNHGLRVRGVCASPLLGPAGNREFFLWLRKDDDALVRANAPN